jgi:dihydrofolate reductase
MHAADTTGPSQPAHANPRSPARSRSDGQRVSRKDTRNEKANREHLHDPRRGHAAPGGPGEDDSDGFTHGGWSVNYWDEQMGQVMGEAMSVPFDLVLGRKTYDIFAAYWPHAPEEAGGKPLNDATKYVASWGHPTLEWRNSVLIEGDAADGIAALKTQDGPELQVHGSGNLIQTLLRRNLIDQYRLWVFPLVIGSGKRLFADGTIPSGLKLTDSKVSTTGVVIGTYEPTGEIVTESFALGGADGA